MKTKKEILEYVISEICAQGRATNGSHCCLETNDGKRCAFSLCITDDSRKALILSNYSGAVSGLSDWEIEQYLKPEFHGHEREFWENLQVLHDVATNWENYSGPTLLSSEGVKQYKKILNNE